MRDGAAGKRAHWTAEDDDRDIDGTEDAEFVGLLEEAVLALQSIAGRVSAKTAYF